MVKLMRGGTAAAITLSTNSTAPVLGAQEGMVIEEIIVSAQRRDESLQNVPISISH